MNTNKHRTIKEKEALVESFIARENQYVLDAMTMLAFAIVR